MGVTHGLVITKDFDMNYRDIIADCNRRMARANAITSDNFELSHELWTEAFVRKGAAIEALFQQSKINYTNCGSVDLRLETCRN